MGLLTSLDASLVGLFFTAVICCSLFNESQSILSNENYAVTEGDIVNLHFDDIDVTEIGTIAFIRTYSNSSEEEILILGTTPTSRRLPETLSSNKTRFRLIQEQLPNGNLKVGITICDVSRQDDANYSLVGYPVRLYFDKNFHYLCRFISQADPPHTLSPDIKISVNFPPKKPTCEAQNNVLLCCHEWARPRPSANWYVNGTLRATEASVDKGNDMWCTLTFADNPKSNYTCELTSKEFPEYKETCTVNSTLLNLNDAPVSSTVNNTVLELVPDNTAASGTVNSAVYLVPDNTAASSTAKLQETTKQQHVINSVITDSPIHASSDNQFSLHFVRKIIITCIVTTFAVAAIIASISCCCRHCRSTNNAQRNNGSQSGKRNKYAMVSKDADPSVLESIF